jgi:hypothetical protein
MIMEGSGPLAWHPAIPNAPETLLGHLEGFGRSAAIRNAARPPISPSDRAAHKYFNTTRMIGRRHRDKPQAIHHPP